MNKLALSLLSESRWAGCIVRKLNKKITVDVEALKAGATEITVCDYNYPDVKEIVQVNVVDKD